MKRMSGLFYRILAAWSVVSVGKSFKEKLKTI